MKVSNIKYQISKTHIKIQNFAFWIVILLFTFYILHFLTGCGRETSEVKEVAIPVEVAIAQERQLQETLQFTGDIEGKNQVQVYPKVGGKLINYKVEEGISVGKGDIIALIDRDVTGFKFEPAPVESPISGIVAKTYLDQGDSVSPQTPIAVVADIDEVKVKIEVTEIDYPKVKLAQIAKIIVDAYPEREFAGKLSKLSTLISPETRTATAEITISNPKHLLVPGMFARISIFVGKHKALSIPLDALLKMPGTGSYYCFKVEKDRAKKTFLKVGLIEDNLVEIKEGLNSDDLVIVSGQGILEAGKPVKVKKIIK